MVSSWVFVGDLERAIAGNLIAVLRTAARHKKPDESFCVGCIVMARADTVSIRGNWETVSGIVRDALDGFTDPAVERETVIVD